MHNNNILFYPAMPEKANQEGDL